MSKDLRSPIAKVRGLGSAKQGAHGWWLMHMSSIALVPLTLWFVVSILCLTDASYADVVDWISNPVSTLAALLFIGVSFFHIMHGLQVVIEDYVGGCWRRGCLISMKFICITLMVAGMFAVLKVSFGG